MNGAHTGRLCTSISFRIAIANGKNTRHLMRKVSSATKVFLITYFRSLRGIRDGIQHRMARTKNGLNQDDYSYDDSDIAMDMLKGLERVLRDKHVSNRFKLPIECDGDYENLRAPSLGLPSDCVVKPKNRFLVLKPQIALRSTIDESAIVLLAVEEISYKGYAVLDESATDQVTSEVLNR